MPGRVTVTGFAGLVAGLTFGAGSRCWSIGRVPGRVAGVVVRVGVVAGRVTVGLLRPSLAFGRVCVVEGRVAEVEGRVTVVVVLVAVLFGILVVVEGLTFGAGSRCWSAGRVPGRVAGVVVRVALVLRVAADVWRVDVAEDERVAAERPVVVEGLVADEDDFRVSEEDWRVVCLLCDVEACLVWA